MPVTLEPVVMVEADAAVIPNEAEGETGLSVRRLYLGGRVEPTPWSAVVATVNLAEEKPQILDASILLRPGEFIELSLGHGKTPLFASARDLAIETTPLPELSIPTRALWPGRDTGLEAHLLPVPLPVEAWVRFGNGSGNALGNDNPRPAGDFRLDLVLGRARTAGQDPFGLRLGGGVHLEDAEDRAGLGGSLPTGFEPWRPPTISGGVAVAQGHGVFDLGPVRLTLEGGVAQEGRSRDTDGNLELLSNVVDRPLDIRRRPSRRRGWDRVSVRPGRRP